MRDAKDKQTGDLLKTAGANRQSAYAERQRRAGRKQVTLWLTEGEATAVKSLLDKLRETGTAESSDQVVCWLKQQREALRKAREG